MSEYEAELIKWERYSRLEDLWLGKPFYEAKERIERSTSYSEIEGIVASYAKHNVERFLRAVKEDYPEYFSSAVDTAQRWFNGLVHEAQSRVVEIFFRRMEKLREDLFAF